MTADGIDSGDGQLAPDTDVAGLADAALRSVMEFAVGIAAAGQKRRPQLPYPSGLKPFLRFQRLDTITLAQVRRAVVADDEFRNRLALVASLELVDELGLVWLQRPEGWQDRVLELDAASQAQRVSDAAEVALRKSERRREAAEQAATRAQAELLAQRDELAREHARREKAEVAASAAVAESVGARRDLEQSQRELAKLRAKLDTETARADRASDASSSSADTIRALETLRDELLAQRSAMPTGAPLGEAETPMPVSSGNAEAAHALRQAASATRDLAEALSSAAGALAETTRSGSSVPHVAAAKPAARTGQRRAPLRKPIAIPGGMFGDSVGAAVHLLRTPSVVALVDGYNVAKLAWPQLALAEQRDCCIDLLEDLARRFGTDIRVIFDGADVIGASARRRLIRVQYSPAGVIADDIIRHEVAGLPATTSVVVVTNDQAIAADVRLLGANVLPSDTLVAAGGRSISR